MTVPFFVPDFTPAMRQAAIDAMDNERFILGESVHKFEEEFARFVGVKHAVSVASGTDALHLTLLATGIKDGEVMTSPCSFMATVNAIKHAGLTPRFSDVDEGGNMEPYDIWTRTEGPVRALLPVHLYGRPTEMGQINELAFEMGIPVIEDACQAHGATYRGKMAGSLGDVGCFSFYTTKNMFVGGDGGMVTTDNPEIADAVKSLRNCGRDHDSQYIHGRFGFTSRLNTIQAAIGRAALKELPVWLQRRREIAVTYRRLLAGSKLILPPRDLNSFSAYHLFVVKSKDRDDLRQFLEGRGISTGIHYPVPLHLQPVMRQQSSPPPLVAAEKHCAEVLSLPMHPRLTTEEVRTVCDAIYDFEGARK